MISAGSGARGARPIRKALTARLIKGEYNNPVRIVAFNIAEGWCRDVTMDSADELRRRSAEYDQIPAPILDFLEVHRR
jgi:hypothetical protein